MGNEIAKEQSKCFSKLSERKIDKLIEKKDEDEDTFFELVKRYLGEECPFKGEREAVDAFNYFLQHAPSKYDNDSDDFTREARGGDSDKEDLSSADRLPTHTHTIVTYTAGKDFIDLEDGKKKYIQLLIDQDYKLQQVQAIDANGLKLRSNSTTRIMIWHDPIEKFIVVLSNVSPQ